MEQIIEFASNHPLLSGGFLLVLVLLAATEISRRTRGFRELSPAEAVPVINAGETVVIDVSAVSDFNKGHIVGAKNYALSRFKPPDADLEQFKGASVLVVCKAGQSAQQAAAALVKLGADEVAVLKGGMNQWKSDNFPVTRS